jgi:glycosyltransferase involved in cell wall biosynthesis
MPKVTVVIATYNWSEVLPYSIASILDQTFTDFELMVVGDCCTDESGEVVAAFADPRVSWLNLPVNSGHQSAPHNEAIRRSDSDLIAYLGHDDLWLPHHLQILVSALDGSAGLSHGSTLLVDPVARPQAFPRGEWTYQKGDWLPPTCVLHSRALAETVGGWRPPWKTGLLESESELWSRLSSESGRQPLWVRGVSSVKLSASRRPDVYVERPHHEQELWLARIRCGESWDALIPTTRHDRAGSVVQRARSRWGRQSWRRRLRRSGGIIAPAAEQTAEQRWRARRRVKGLDGPS